ncbi:MAG TPA: peptidyl-prolyl cis-trans isomerase [Pseudolabrys sp.]|nr:peptidyl-prolyl cis-trans isomerase [Pseudolabrys sp.]
MLRGIQNASRNWLGKIVMTLVMGLLVVSFAVWGIGDIFRGFGLSTVAKIGKTEISIEQFRSYYNERLQALSRQIGRPLSSEQARALGLDRQIIGQLVAESTLDERARDLRLNLSDAEIAQQIRNDKNFAGPSGQFDHARFEALIRNAGYNEARYIGEQRRTLLRRELADTIAGQIGAPNVVLAAIQRFQEETRTLDYLTLGAAQAGDIPAPTAEELTAYFDERKILFRAPEYRKVVLVSLTPADQARWQTVPDAEARKIYDEDIDKYGTPERRHIRQIVFQNADEARAASEKIAGGATFDSIAAERGMKPQDTDLGTVTKTALVDPAIADAAFALKEGETSAPVKGRFGTVILQAVKIEPGQTKPFADVAQQIKNEIALSRARSEMVDLQNKIEDARAGGDTLAEAAQKAGITTRTIEAIDRSGRAPDGAQVTNLPQGVDLLPQIFATEIGVETDPVQIPDGGYVWFEVTGITPARERTLDEVKPQVEARWRDDEIAKRLKTKAEDIAGRLKAGEKMDAVAAAAGVKVEQAKDIKRNAAGGPLPQTVVDAAFRTPKDGVGSVEGAQPTDRIVFRVAAINDPGFDPASDQMKQLADTLKPAFAESVLNEYIARLQADYGVSINSTVFNQVVGGSSADN